jgi:hypothetical protein
MKNTRMPETMMKATSPPLYVPTAFGKASPARTMNNVEHCGHTNCTHLFVGMHSLEEDRKKEGGGEGGRVMAAQSMRGDWA